MNIHSARFKAYIALIITTAIWGIAGPVIKSTLTTLPPFTFLFWRFAMVGVFVIPYYVWYLAKHPIKRSDIIPLSIYGLMATTINLGLIFLGFARTSAIEGTLISSLSPMFIVMLGVLILKEKITKIGLVGLMLVIAGSVIIVIEPLVSGNGLALTHSLGNFLILLAAFEWAFFVLFTKKSFGKYSPILITLHSTIVALITFAPLAYLESGFKIFNFFPRSGIPLSETIFNLHTFLGVFYMAFFSYFVAYFLYEYAMEKIEISKGSIFAYLQPLFATPVAVIWLAEPLTASFLVGAGVIAIGVVVSEWK